jgi:hypothetical protein
MGYSIVNKDFEVIITALGHHERATHNMWYLKDRNAYPLFPDRLQ